MSSPTHFDLSQNDAEMLGEQCREIQRRHEEEQQSLLWLEKAVEARHAEHAAQKARREVEARAKEEAERQRIAEEERKKRAGRRTEMKRRGLRMALEKVRRGGLCHPPSVRLVVLYFPLF